MNYSALTIDWLKNSQQEDGAWTSEEFRKKPPARLTDQLVHKIAYTSRIIRTLSLFDSTDSINQQGCHFLLESDGDLDHPLYRLALKTVAFTAAGRYDLARERINRLLTLIQSGGVVIFNARRESVFFDNCCALDAILAGASHDKKLLRHDKVKELILNIANSMPHGDALDYWMWRMALLSKAKNLGAENSKFNKALSDFENMLSQIQRSFKQTLSSVEKPTKPTRTPNLVCMEFRAAHNLSNLSYLYVNGDIGRDLVLPIADYYVNALLDQHNLSYFFSETIGRTGKSSRVKDTYLTSAIIQGLFDTRQSQVLLDSTLGDELEEFFSGTEQDDLDIPRSAISEHLQAMPNEIRSLIRQHEDLESKLNKIIQLVSGPRVQTELGTPDALRLLTGFSTKLVFSTNAPQLPTFTKWSNKINKILGMNLTFRR